MKFEISITPRDGAKVQRQQIKGLQSLEDACRVALALGPVHWQTSLVGVWLPGGRRAESSALLAVYCDGDQRAQNGFMEKARHTLGTTLAARSVNKTRREWLRAKDAEDKTFSIRLFALLPAGTSPERFYVNQAAITALFANDFATVERLMRPPDNDGSPTPAN